jgi:hypothetical protein
MAKLQNAVREYEAPTLVEIGRIQDLTLADCVAKTFGSSDGHTMMGSDIRCDSA